MNQKGIAITGPSISTPSELLTQDATTTISQNVNSSLRCSGYGPAGPAPLHNLRNRAPGPRASTIAQSAAPTMPMRAYTVMLKLWGERIGHRLLGSRTISGL